MAEWQVPGSSLTALKSRGFQVKVAAQKHLTDEEKAKIEQAIPKGDLAIVPFLPKPTQHMYYNSYVKRKKIEIVKNALFPCKWMVAIQFAIFLKFPMIAEPSGPLRL